MLSGIGQNPNNQNDQYKAGRGGMSKIKFYKLAKPLFLVFSAGVGVLIAWFFKGSWRDIILLSLTWAVFAFPFAFMLGGWVARKEEEDD